jgi:F0F1-type ATP synthase assembly protein I
MDTYRHIGVRKMLPTENDKYAVNSMAEAMKWVSVVTTVVGLMIFPALGGIWIDHLLGTKCLFVILGVMVGFVGGMYCLLEMAKANADHPESLRR